MKKWKIACLILVISTCTVGLFTAYGENRGNKLADWGYSLGVGIKNIKKPNTSINRNIVSYVNDIPVYEDEIIERIEKNKAILDTMKTTDNSATSLPWGSNPFDYVYREKFDLDYAKVNGIEVSKEELEKYISSERAIWESEKDIFEQYLAGRGITEEEFFNEIAPPSYEKTIIKNRVREHILQSAGMSEKDNEAKQKYLDEFYKENIKVKEIDKNFIKMYSE